MSDVFDPYCRWLGLPDDRRPANHYELLGIDLYEIDPGVIARAADVLTARVRSVRPGQHVVQWQQLLDDLAEAKRCLLDPSAKADYDAALRGGTGRQEPAPQPQATAWDPTTPPAAAAQTPAQPVPDWGAPTSAPGAPGAADGPAPAEAAPWSPLDGAASGSTRVRPNARRRSSATWAAAQLGLGVLVGVLLMGAAMLAYRLFSRQESPPTGQTAASQTGLNSGSAKPDDTTGSSSGQTTPAGPGPSSSKKPKRTLGKKPGPGDEPKRKGPTQPKEEADPQQAPGPKPPPKTEPQPGPLPKRPPSQGPESTSPAERARQQALEQAISEARRSMAAHDLGGARRHLSAAGKSAKTPEEQATIARLSTLLGHLEAFWSRMGRVVAGLEAAEMLPIGETFVAVVESSLEQVTVRAAGQIRTYPLRQMPPKLTEALINTKFRRDAVAKVLIGAYLAVDPDGDPGRARRLWEEAAQQGENVEDLILELEHWPGRPDGAHAKRPGATR